jgi:predicted neutral ceramidase superfamily lipid hydrolase
MPCRLPSLENIGTVIIILKLAIGDIVACLLLLGVRYGSAGETTTLFATIVLGGKLKVDQTELLAKAAAIVLRSVVMAAVVIIRP